MRSSLLLALLAVPAIAAAAPAEPTDAAARQLIVRYYAAIERGDFRSAYLAWDNDGQASGKTYAAFRQGFAATAHSRVVAGIPTGADAGMSQRWIQVPVDVYATLKNGRQQHFRGRYTLHRVVPGVSENPADTQWHIASATLTAVR
jgi:hypothetical protein